VRGGLRASHRTAGWHLLVRAAQGCLLGEGAAGGRHEGSAAGAARGQRPPPRLRSELLIESSSKAARRCVPHCSLRTVISPLCCANPLSLGCSFAGEAGAERARAGPASSSTSSLSGGGETGQPYPVQRGRSGGTERPLCPRRSSPGREDAVRRMARGAGGGRRAAGGGRRAVSVAITRSY
jgi:hypothetical protein